MIVGKVVGSLVSTRKNDNLIGSKFMIIEPLAKMQSASLQGENCRIVAVDNIGVNMQNQLKLDYM